MTTISPYYGAYIASPPPPTPAPAVPTNPDGTPKETEVVVVWGHRSPTTAQVFGPYGALTGPQENSRRDQSFFFGEGGLAGRAEALGMDANASITPSLGDEYGDLDDFGFDEIGTIRTVPFVNPVLEALGVDDVELSNRVANHIVAKHSNWWPGNSELPNVVSDPASLQRLIVAPALSNAHRMIFDPETKKVTVYADLPLAGRDELGRTTNTYKLVLGPAQHLGALRVITAFPVSAGSGRD